MSESNKPKWALPYDSPLPADARKAPYVRVARIAAYVLLAAAMVIPVFQLYSGTLKVQRDLKAFHAKYGENPPADVQQPKDSKGAIGRWRKAVLQFWAGENIYLNIASTQGPAEIANISEGSEVGGEDSVGHVRLHPNMPFTVILLTPFSYGPAQIAVVTWTLLKIVVLGLVFLMVVSITNHNGLRMPDWVLGLAMLWSILLIIGDLQHANTNAFVLGAVVLHLWLFRKGKDMLSGGALALAICLKMTPAIFVLYWLYQRNWKLLAGCLLAIAIFTVVIPAGACIGIAHGNVAAGVDHFATLNQTWLDNLIIPGLIKSAPYPIYINQSLPGVMYRFLTGGPEGDIQWNPDDVPSYDTLTKHGWINFANLTLDQARQVIRILQLAFVLVIGWAIGWRKLPRDDGRRTLQYGMVAIGMLILNQRTWDEHAGVMLIADIAVWYAIAFGNVSRRARGWALVLAIAAGPLVWLTGTDPFALAGIIAGKGAAVGKAWADISKAYGMTFWHFVLMLAACVILSISLRRKDAPYFAQRQKLSAQQQQ